MNKKAETGQRGEDLAAEYLQDEGYALLERNYRYKRSEIDLITRKSGVLVFVEVKTKTSNAFGDPEVAVDEKKAAKVMEGAQAYIEAIDWQGNIRFDVVSVLIEVSGHRIQHFEDAFY